MKFILKLCCLFLLLTITFACEDLDDNAVPSNLKVNDFIWKGMNLYYLWQEDVPNLDNNRFANQGELNTFLTNYSNPTNLFNSLRVDNSLDRFSVIFSDYRVLEGILSGNTKNNGVDFGLRYKTGSTTDIFGWVRYIIPNSDASSKDIQRGDIFYAINGTPLTIDNYQSLLNSDSYSIDFADFDNGNITPTGQSLSLTKTALAENPILINNIFNEGNHKIGYLMYNGFFPSYDGQLNTVFGQLKSQNITDLVLDLRYNSGGSIRTATRLASMITGQFNGQLFGKEQWNAKAQAYYEDTNPSNLRNNFSNSIGNTAINSLQLSKIYILTSKSTASASELIINCLKPYIEVIQIGDVTTGKNVGSITLYDSPTFTKSGANRSHYYAMQPIVLKIVNKNDFGDYMNGLAPNYSLQENLGNLNTLGNISEPLLSTAIDLITANGRVLLQNSSILDRDFEDTKSMTPLTSQMYKELN